MGGEAPRRFATDFRAHVVPVIQREITRLAGDMADNAIEFPEAMAELLHLAQRRGAGYLPDAIYDDLREWISVTLLDEATLAEDARDLVLRLLREPSRDVLRQAVREFLSDDR